MAAYVNPWKYLHLLDSSLYMYMYMFKSQNNFNGICTLQMTGILSVFIINFLKTLLAYRP